MNNQALYLQIINLITKEFLQQKTFDTFYQATQQSIKNIYAQNNDEISMQSIRKAITEFYAQHGIKAVVFFQAHDMQIKPQITNQENNIYIDFITRQLDKDKFAEMMKNEPSSQISRYFNQLFASLKDSPTLKDSTTIKDIVRNAVKKTLGLNQSDSVFFNDLEPYIKNFDFDLVKNNTQIRELRKSSYIGTFLNPQVKQDIDSYISQPKLDTLISQTIQNIIDEKIYTNQIAPLDFYSGFSLALIQDISTQISSLTQSRFPINTINRYAIEMYLYYKTTIYKKLAQAILEGIQQNKASAESYITFFDGKDKKINGVLTHIPIITDITSKTWNLSNIKQTLTSEYSINTNLAQLKNSIESGRDKLLELETQITSNKALVSQKELEIQTLNQEYETKKQHQAQKNQDVESRNATSKLINEILQQKITILDAIATLNNAITNANEEKKQIILKEQQANEQIKNIINNNQSSIQTLQNLTDALGYCLESVVTELDNNA